MNTTDEYWAIDGVSLAQYGWNIATVGGSRYDLPVRRGENITLAYRPGQVHRPKLADARTIQLIMWVAGVDPATGASTSDPTLRWNDSWDFLRRLVWKPDGSQVVLTRRWKLTVDGTPTITVADALAEISDPMAPTMTNRGRAEFTMQLLLADPYFYGATVTTTVNLGTPVTVVNPGHDIAAHGHLEVDLIGPLTNPVLTNTTPNPDAWVRYNAAIPGGQTVTLTVDSYLAFQGATNVIGKVANSGARHWMGLQRGTNTFTLSASAGTGHAVVRYRPPYV